MKHKVKHLHFIADKARNRETIARGGPAHAMELACAAANAAAWMAYDEA